MLEFDNKIPENQMCVILIADDDITVKTGLKHFLNDEGFKVLTVNNGLEAYELASKSNPDIILSDIHMPEMDGFELRDKLKVNPVTAAIPVIFITADVTSPEDKRASSSPANIFITKPFMFEDILKAINIYLIGHDD